MTATRQVSFIHRTLHFLPSQANLEVITRSRHKARENVHAQATLGFGFTSDWLKEWCENFEPITEWSNAKPKQFANYFRHPIENRSSVCSLLFWSGLYKNPGHGWKRPNPSKTSEPRQRLSRCGAWKTTINFTANKPKIYKITSQI